MDGILPTTEQIHTLLDNALGPKAYYGAFNVIQGQSTSNVTSITQKAALAAITGSQEPVKAMLDEYRVRRDSIHAWLTAHPGIRCVKPKGAFYLFPDISGLLAPDGLRPPPICAGAHRKEQSSSPR